ncbi:phage protein [Pseudescherichia vulneris]|nr:phage protein [Pseudescherichia vulneris]
MPLSSIYRAIADRRSGSISICKSFDAYRAWVIVEAGHYDAIQLPDGTLRKHPRSIAFASMDELEFQQLYRAALDVLWRWILSRAFRDQREAENAAAQLMHFGS